MTGAGPEGARGYDAIPGPRGLPLLGMGPAFLRDPFGYVEGLRPHGDVVRVALGTRELVYLLHPDAIAEVLLHRAKDFHKGAFLERGKLLFGNGLVTSDGDHWRRHRAAMGPAFHPRAVRGYGPAMEATIAAGLDSWAKGGAGPATIDAGAELMALTLEVVLRVLFGTSGGDDAAVVARAFTEVSDFFSSSTELMLPLPPWVPTPANRRLNRALGDIERVVTRILVERRAQALPAEPRDLLDRMLAARDDEGRPMADADLRDEIRTLVLAGHETTAMAVTMGLWLLAGHPAEQDRIATEVAALGRPPSTEDALPATERALKEAMRLYPSVPILFRAPREDTTIAGWSLPRDTVLGIPPWAVHRDPRWFPDPSRFDPDRWLPEAEAARPRFSYFPFGGGPRVCIGAALAMAEGRLLLAEVVRRWRVERVDAEPPELFPAITLRLKSPARLRLVGRGASPG